MNPDGGDKKHFFLIKERFYYLYIDVHLPVNLVNTIIKHFIIPDSKRFMNIPQPAPNDLKTNTEWTLQRPGLFNSRYCIAGSRIFADKKRNI
jgi:hypothetical protein